MCKKRVAKKVANKVVELSQLTEIEQDVLHLITNEFLTIKQVAIRRQTSTQAIYKIKKNLVKKGVLNNKNQRVAKEGGCFKPLNHQIRLHNEQYSIKIIWKDGKYNDKINKKIILDNNTIMCYRDNIQVYSNNSFFGDSVDEAEFKSLNYWSKFFNKLEYNLKCILVKERSQNIERVRCEFAEVGNELATQCIKEHEKIKVSGVDGKIWLLIDNSFNYNELETTHAKTSNNDMKNVIRPFFNDLRNNEVTTMSDLRSLFKEAVMSIESNAISIQAILKLISPNETLNNTSDDKNIKIEKPIYVG